MREPSIPVVHELDLSREREIIRTSYARLEEARDRFVKSLQRDAHLPAMFEDGSTGLTARNRAIDIFKEFYLPLDEEKEEHGIRKGEITVKGRGVVGVSNQTAQLAETLNQSKNSFYETIGGFAGDVLVKLDKPRLNKRDNRPSHLVHFEQVSLSRYLLDNVIGKRFSIRQAVRQIEVLRTVPRMISYTYLQLRNVQRYTVADARALVLSRGSEVEQQRALQILDSIHRYTPLALVSEGKPEGGRWVANIVRTDDEQGQLTPAPGDRRKRAVSKRFKVTTPIPILVVLEPGQEFPIVKKVDSEVSGVRRHKPRNDSRGVLPRALINFGWMSLHRYTPDYEQLESAKPAWRKRVDKQATVNSPAG